jgi:hypothetical protein
MVPVITGATKMVTKELKKNLEAILAKNLVESLHKTAMHGTSHIIKGSTAYCTLKPEKKLLVVKETTTTTTTT